MTFECFWVPFGGAGLDFVSASSGPDCAPSVSRRDCFTNTQASVVHLSCPFHSPSVMPSYCICGFKPQLTLWWPLPSSGQNRKRKQTGISGGSCIPPGLSKARDFGSGFKAFAEANDGAHVHMQTFIYQQDTVAPPSG